LFVSFSFFFECFLWFVVILFFADKKNNDFELPFLWFISSIHPDVFRALLLDICSPINLDLKSPNVLCADHGVWTTDGVCHRAQGWPQLTYIFEIYHPYWLHRKIFFRDHNGRASFGSVCQLQIDLGMSDSERCGITGFLHQQSKSRKESRVQNLLYTSSLLTMRGMRQQQEQILKQERAIEQLMEVVGALNATVFRLVQSQHT
jgi:hypothetical protein